VWQQEFVWFFTIFHQEFRKNNPIAFEVLIVLAVAHLFGFYNPKQLADFLEVPHQQFYTELKDWSVYHVKKMLLRFMVKQEAQACDEQECRHTLKSWDDIIHRQQCHGPIRQPATLYMELV
jgi:hypothetical protein